MRLVHRPIEVWPGEPTPAHKRQRSPFTTRDTSSEWSWRRKDVPLSDTLELLDRELRALGVRDEAVLQVAVRERDLRLDGQLRADARPEHPGIILNFKSRHGELSYACDTFTTWQANLRAIAKGLEALRLVDRYGIGQGRQYTGYRAIGAGTPMPAAAMTVEDAARFLIEHGEWGDVSATVDEILDAGSDVRAAYFREAAKKLHPDAGGNPELFKRLVEARDLLEKEIA